jgi:uncharacterized protein
MNFIKASDYIILRLQNELNPSLTYHSLEHTLDVHAAAVKLANLEKVDEYTGKLIETAAMYHDSGMIYDYNNHEEVSVEIVREFLPQFGYEPSEINSIASMIMKTIMPQDAKTLAEQILCDADMDTLGRDDFFIHSFRLQLEWRVLGNFNTSLREWLEFELQFLTNHRFYTATAIRLSQTKKLEHINSIKMLLNQ